MTKLIKFPDVRRTMEEACLWLVCIEEGLSAEQEREVKEWLASDPQHAKALIHVAELWGELDSLSELAEIFPLRQYRPRRHGAWHLKTALLAAGGLAVAGFLAYFLVQQPSRSLDSGGVSVTLPGVRETSSERFGDRPVDELDVSRRTYQTAVGEQLSARLPDGSVITLNTDSALEVEYTRSERRIEMRHGEVSFDVARDTLRPFRVVTSSRIVQAVGTVFNIEIGSESRLEVTVSEGRVRVLPIVASAPLGSTRQPRGGTDDTTADLTVGAGERATIDGIQETVRRFDPSEIKDQLAWQQGMLVFRGAPLEEVLADVSRYTTVRLTIADEAIRNRRVGGYFRAGDIDALLIALRESFDIEPRRVGDEILLTASQ